MIYKGATKIVIRVLTIDLSDILPNPLFQISLALFYKLVQGTLVIFGGY